MDLSVVLIFHNSTAFIRACIESVIESCKSVSYEIIAVDNGSDDDSLNQISDIEDRLILIKNSENLGVSKARNQALKKASGDVIWILDIDTIANENAFIKLYNHILNNQKTGLCSCELRNQNGRIQNSCRQYPSLSSKIKSLLNAKSKPDNDLHYYKEITRGEPFNVDYLIGACQMFRKEILDQIGLLDEKIFYGPEDADFCHRIHKKGYNAIHIPGISITHHYERKTIQKPFSSLTIKHIKGLIHYWKKWGPF
jgi:GT2 family glycosyltransferase